MGNTQTPTKNQAISQQTTQQLRSLVQNSIKHRRLHLSNEQNLHEKLSYAVQKLDDLFIQELLLGNNTLVILDHCKVQESVLELLTKIDKKAKVKVINLGYNHLTCEHLKALANFHLIHLTTLYLDHNQIGSLGCYNLIKPKLHSLHTLDLTSNHIDEEGCRALATGNWPQLRTLLLSQNKFKTKGFLFLSKGQWPRLMYLQVKNNPFEPTKRLQEIKFRTQVKGFTIQFN